jgi:hypothetical protein
MQYANISVVPFSNIFGTAGIKYNLSERPIWYEPTFTVSILPSPANDNDDLVCNWTAPTDRTIPLAFSWWYQNLTLLKYNDSFTLGKANTSIGDYYCCNVTLYDFYYNSSQMRSNCPVIGDTEAPVISGIYLINTTVELGNPVAIYGSCTDASGIYSLIAEINRSVTCSATDNQTLTYLSGINYSASISRPVSELIM